jgi:hypothetical protein
VRDEAFDTVAMTLLSSLRDLPDDGIDFPVACDAP